VSRASLRENVDHVVPKSFPKGFKVELRNNSILPVQYKRYIHRRTLRLSIDPCTMYVLLPLGQRNSPHASHITPYGTVSWSNTEVIIALLCRWTSASLDGHHRRWMGMRRLEPGGINCCISLTTDYLFRTYLAKRFTNLI